MHPAKVIQIAWKGISSNKLRSLLTMLGVIIGVGAVIVMISISAGTEAAISIPTVHYDVISKTRKLYTACINSSRPFRLSGRSHRQPHASP